LGPAAEAEQTESYIARWNWQTAIPTIVIPAKAGTHLQNDPSTNRLYLPIVREMGPRFRGDDG